MQTVDQVLDRVLEWSPEEYQQLSRSEKAILALAQKWHIKKVKVKLLELNPNKPVMLQFDPCTANAILALFQYQDIPVSSYAGVIINRIITNLDKHFR